MNTLNNVTDLSTDETRLDLTTYPFDVRAVALVPERLCRRHTAIPLMQDSGRLVVAMDDPNNVFAIDDIRDITGLEISAVGVRRADVLAAIDRHHRGDAELDDLRASLEGSYQDASEFGIREASEDAPVVRFVNLLITRAVQDGASDIHIEPTETDLRVRFRIDGVLHDAVHSAKTTAAAVTSRLKIMADINIAERRIPQDGRITLTSRGKKIELRVATLPTVWGEKIVMRILDNSTALLKLSDLGFAPSNYDIFQRSFTKPHGMVLVTGPTGSGKSTTLYATLNIVSQPEVNCLTVEDPVEYRLAGISQVQVNDKAGLTFGAALRSILRCDPDVVLLGEVRDSATAQIAVEAALTGHLVLSTLHTNDAPSAITRLIKMGIEPFLVGSALECVLAQRLARRLCSRCKQAYIPDRQALVATGYPFDPAGELPTLYRPVGCLTCSKTGYRGRVAVHEVMAVSEEIEKMAVERAATLAIRQVAREQGMTTMREDGLRKVAAGITSLEEILRIVV